MSDLIDFDEEEAERRGEIRAAQSIAAYIERAWPKWNVDLQLVYDACMGIIDNPDAARDYLRDAEAVGKKPIVVPVE